MFIITSDDINWCQENIVSNSNFSKFKINLKRNTISKSEDEDGLFDFTLLSICNNSIFDFGSFGFWAAALTQGEVILPINYTRANHYVTEAIMKYKPKNWTIVDVTKL